MRVLKYCSARVKNTLYYADLQIDGEISEDNH